MIDSLTVGISADASALLSALSEFEAALESRLEIRETFVGLLDSGEQLCRVDSDVSVAAFTGELIVSLHPSDALLGLVAAARAGDRDFCVAEHATSPVRPADVTTSEGIAQ